MGLFSKREEKEKEPQYYLSKTNIPTYNYKVYYMSLMQKIIYFLIGFVVGAAVGYLFYGGIGKDEFGRATTTTIVLNITIPMIVGTAAGFIFLSSKNKSIVAKQKIDLGRQFRDMLEALTTSLGAGKNVNDSFFAVYEDLKIQYEEDAFILKELEVIIAGIHNNIAIEEILEDFGNRSDNDDIMSFSNVFRIAYRKGGNIKDIIRNTHNILSEKMEISEDIETLMTSNKTEQNIMIIMPILLIGLIKAMSPEFAHNFVTPSGIASTTISIIIFVVAYFVGKSVLNIRI